MPSAADSSVLAVLQTVRDQFPSVPFLALGQTVFWDEPMKAVWRRLLDENLPGARLIAGVHDTDYFAKTSAHLGDDQEYALLPHDDGRTRDLWSAAGELSALFGSESVPSRAVFLKHNVPFDWLARDYPGGKAALYADKTAAWGWRGIVSTGSHSVIAHDVPVLEIADILLEQLDWGFSQGLLCLDDPATRAEAESSAVKIRGWVTDFLADCSNQCRLSDLYQALLPRFYELLLGNTPAAFETTASTSLFQFHRGVCHLPRFQLLEAFLNPRTRHLARQAYNEAVAGSGSGIYTLSHFGEGAIPFDLVIPGKGRGTLRLTKQGPVIETQPLPTDLCDGCPIESLEDLASVVEAKYGREAALVGKAVTLVDMIAAEHLVVFHETASGYTPTTQQFNAHLREAGISLPLHPIVRLTYPTWEALAAVSSSIAFHLPPHLAAAFGRETMAAPQFGQEWRAVVEAQRRVLRETRELHKVRDLLTYLQAQGQHSWCDRLGEYEMTLNILKEIAGKSAVLRERIEEHESEMAMWQAERQELERRKGEDWRHNIQPLREKLRDAAPEAAHALQHAIDRQMAIRATAFSEPLALCRERITATKHLIGEFRRQRRLLERGPEAQNARAVLAAIVRDAQWARLELVSNAYLTVEGLEHTNLRPTAWWLPFVDASGTWFEAIAAGTQAGFESLLA